MIYDQTKMTKFLLNDLRGIRMYAVIFELKPKAEAKDRYLDIAAELRQFLEDRDGFIFIERLQSLTDEGKVLSISFWRDEAVIKKWRNLQEHRIAQRKGKASLFHAYRIRVAKILRDYTAADRNGAPSDSNAALTWT